MSTFKRRVMIFLAVAVALTYTVPETLFSEALAAEPEENLAFVQIEPEKEVVKFPALPPEPEPEPEPAVDAAEAQVQYAAVPSPSQAPAISGNFRTVTVTAYSSTVDQTDGNPFITASGAHVRWGTIASNFLPFGTKVRFPDYFGDQVFVVQDRTARKYSNRADIWFPSRGEALQFGKRTLRLEIL